MIKCIHVNNRTHEIHVLIVIVMEFTHLYITTVKHCQANIPTESTSNSTQTWA